MAGEFDTVDDNVTDGDGEDLGYDLDNFDDEAEAIEDGEYDNDAEEDDIEEAEQVEGDDGDDPVEDLIELENGESVALSELRSGYLKEQDYRAKTTELAEVRKQTSALQDTLNQRLQTTETTYQNLIGFLQGLVPPEPDISLIQTDPSAYQYQNAMRERTIAELSQVLEARQEFAGTQQGYSDEDLTRGRDEQDALLAKAMPHLSDPAKRTAFDAAIQKTAADFGFSDDEISGAFDHRILQLVHYAGLGKVAERNRDGYRKRKGVPKPTKGSKARGTQKAASQAKSDGALERLTQTGSVDDAVRALTGG
ncbi:hypothetical protein KMP13_02305 [Epibacterium ulvae]|uniref:hypothetical protein n=1 Tax=Epibacterium ulvae TaxID=1156985 RepID=UPI001BFC3318|nr:hypothetical protein [Epibacterium ulvae]MBT8152746.1 hypothetical protein [Epibacterium ulvae]